MRESLEEAGSAGTQVKFVSGLRVFSLNFRDHFKKKNNNQNQKKKTDKNQQAFTSVPVQSHTNSTYRSLAKAFPNHSVQVIYHFQEEKIT